MRAHKQAVILEPGATPSHLFVIVKGYVQQMDEGEVVATLGPLAYILVLYALRMAPLSHVAPAREVSMLVAALLGGRLLGEADRGLRLLGAACIAGGVIALALG